MAESGVHNRLALGASGKLGDLYDIRRDEFCGISIFKRDLPNNVVTSLDRPTSQIHLVTTETSSEKFRKLNINADMGVSILAGLVALNGSGEYLKDEKTSARTIKNTLIYNIETTIESINIRHEDLTNVFDVDAISKGIGTHVVTEIIWGASAILSCSYNNSTENNTNEVKGKLSSTLSELKEKLSDDQTKRTKSFFWKNFQGEGLFRSDSSKKHIAFDVKVYGDVPPQNEDLPTNLNSALRFIRRLPGMILKSNKGKGKPVAFRMLPLSSLPNNIGISIAANQRLRRMSDVRLDSIVRIFDDINAGQQLLNDIRQDGKDYSFSLLPQEIHRINDFESYVRSAVFQYKADMANIVTGFRSGAIDDDKVVSLIDSYQSAEWSRAAVEQKCEAWEAILQKITFSKFLNERGVKLIRSSLCFQTELLKDHQRSVYVLYFTEEAKLSEERRWNDNLNLFLRLNSRKIRNTHFYAIDGNIHPSLIPKGMKSGVQIIQKGIVVERDLLRKKRAHIESYPEGLSFQEKIMYRVMQFFVKYQRS